MALGLAGVPSGYGGTFTGKTVADGISRLGLTGVPQGRFLQTTKNPATSVGSDPKTRLGVTATSRGQLGSFAGKVTVPSNVITFSNTPSATYAPATFVVAKDRVIDFTGIEVAPVTYDFDIIQGGQTVTFANTPAATYAGKTFELDQTVSGNRNVFFDTVTYTYTTHTFTVAQEKILDFDVALSSYQTQVFDIIPGVFGEQTLSNADIYAINQSLAPQFAAINASISSIQSQVTDSLSGVDFGPKGIYVPKKATPKERAVNQKRRKRKNKKLALDMLNTAMKLVTKEI